MINLGRIKEFVQSISEIKIDEKDFSIDENSYHFAGFYKQNGETKLLLLAYSETLCELKEEAEALHFELLNQPNPPTVRENERLSIRFEKDFAGIKSVIINNKEFFVCSSQTTQLSSNEAEHAILLAEFIKSGWNCPHFTEFNPDNIYVITSVLAENVDFNTIEKITFSFRSETKRFLSEIPLILEPGNINKELSLPNGQKIYIRKISPFDLHKHTEELFSNEKIINSFSPKELKERRSEIEKSNEELCPKGKCFITVEYEAPENISLDIKTIKNLDFKIQSSGGAFAVIFPATLTAEHHGYKVKVATINEPTDPDFCSVDAEIFSYSETTKIEDVEL